MLQTRIFEYFVVCGLGPDIRTLDGNRGFQGKHVFYLPSLLDQFPPSDHNLYPLPLELPTFVLPGGVKLYEKEDFSADDALRNYFEDKINPSTNAQQYHIVISDSDGSKTYVSCISFRDLICEDITAAYHLDLDTYADKCICLVSRAPTFKVVRLALDKIFKLYTQSRRKRSKPLWEVISHLVATTYLPTPGKSKIRFYIEKHPLMIKLSEGVLPLADISFEPLLTHLSVMNLLRVFSAVVLEQRILIRSNEYYLLTMVSEILCHLLYPFEWQHAYIPVVPFTKIAYIEVQEPYIMGLHSNVDTTGVSMEGVVIVDLDQKSVTGTEELPTIPMLEYDHIGGSIDKLFSRGGIIWQVEDDLQLRSAFLMFFASIVAGRHNQCNPMITEFFKTRSYMNYLVNRDFDTEKENYNFLNELKEAMDREEDVLSLLREPSKELQTIDVEPLEVGMSGFQVYARFPAYLRTAEEQKHRKNILKSADEAFTRMSMVVSKVILQGSWQKLLKLETPYPLSSDVYVTIQGLIKSKNGTQSSRVFMQCIEDHIASGLECRLSPSSFRAVTALIKQAANYAASNDDLSTLALALEISAQIYMEKATGVKINVLSDLGSLPIWKESRFWEQLYADLHERSPDRCRYETKVTEDLTLIRTRMDQLGFGVHTALDVLDLVAQKNSIGYKLNQPPR